MLFNDLNYDFGNFNWSDLKNSSQNYCTLFHVDSLRKPAGKMFVNDSNSLNKLMYAIEEEALMYVVNELPKGKDVHIDDIENDDIVIVSQHTSALEIKHNYVSLDNVWHRQFIHEGDMYEKVDMIMRLNSSSGFIQQRMAVAIKTVPDTQTELFPAGHAWVEFAVMENTAYDFPYTMHRVSKRSTYSTLDLFCE